jgi:hypothetical protein
MKLKAQIILLIALITGSAAAQDAPRVQIFGGYSLADIAPCGTSGGNCGFESTGFQGSVSPKASTHNGWNAAATYLFARNIGVTADFGGYYGNLNYTNAATTNSSTYTILFGPTWTARLGRVSPFAHFLFGLESVHLNFTSGNGFAFAPGGGLDYSVHKHVKLRLAQLDYLATHQPSSFGGGYSSGFRYSGGLVLSF